MRQFNIPAGPLEVVLGQFQTDTGLQFTYTRDAVKQVQSPGVTGPQTVQQALRRVFAGTGVAYRFTGETAVAVDFESVATAVQVSETLTLASPKYAVPLRELPQTITVIPKNVIEEQGATSLRDVLRNVPGLTMTAGEGGVTAGDNITMRGFSARNDVFVDGVRDLGPQSRDPFNLEQVEVIKGPNSAFNGRGSTGGSINLVSKAPNLNQYFGFGAMFGTDETKRVNADVNIPFKRAAFRMNALAHEAGVAGRDAVNSQRWGLAPSLAVGLGTPTRLTLSYYKLRQDNLPDYGIPWVTATHNVLAAYRDQPAPVDRNTYYGMKTRDRETLNSDLGTVRLEHEFSDTLSIRNQFRYGVTKRDSITTAPRFASNDNLVINRNGPSWITDDKITDNQTDLRAEFETGKIRHQVTTGAAFTREAQTRVARTVAGAPPTTLYNPNFNEPFNGTYTFNPVIGDATGNSQALYAFDTVRLHPKFDIQGGFRWERFDTDGITTANASLKRTDKMLSFRTSATYRPSHRGNVYFAAGTSLNPSIEGLSYNSANTAIEPEKTYTYEIGSKWDLVADKLTGTAALFRVQKTNARTPGVLPDDPAQVLQGEQKVDGVELGLSGNVTRDFRLFGAYTLMNAKVVDSNTPAEVGMRMINTPRNSANIWATYTSPFRLLLGGGIRFTGKRYGNNTNTRFVDEFWTVDLMASFPVHKNLDLRFNLYNLNNAYYFDRLGGGHLIPGAARSAMISTNVRF